MIELEKRILSWCDKDEKEMHFMQFEQKLSHCD